MDALLAFREEGTKGLVITKSQNSLFSRLGLMSLHVMQPCGCEESFCACLLQNCQADDPGSHFRERQMEDFD